MGVRGLLEELKRRGFEIVGHARRGGELYIGVKMPELVPTMEFGSAFIANFPVEEFKRKFNLAPAHPSTIDYEFWRKAKIKPEVMLRRPGLRGLLEQALNRHKPVYLCRNSVWLPAKADRLLELLEHLRDWYNKHSPQRDLRRLI